MILVSTVPRPDWTWDPCTVGKFTELSLTQEFSLCVFKFKKWYKFVYNNYITSYNNIYKLFSPLCGLCVGENHSTCTRKKPIYPTWWLDSLVVECWLRVREVPGSIPSQGLRHTKDVIKMVSVVPLFRLNFEKGNTSSFSRIKIRT